MTTNNWMRDYYVLSTNFEMFISKFGKTIVLNKIDSLLNDSIANDNYELKEKLYEAKRNLEETIRLEAETYEATNNLMY